VDKIGIVIIPLDEAHQMLARLDALYPPITSQASLLFPSRVFMIIALREK